MSNQVWDVTATKDAAAIEGTLTGEPLDIIFSETGVDGKKPSTSPTMGSTLWRPPAKEANLKKPGINQKAMVLWALKNAIEKWTRLRRPKQ